MKDRAVPEGIDDVTDHDMWFNEKVKNGIFIMTYALLELDINL